jgi:hypothetical protein
MKNKLKGFYLLVSSLFIALLHLPFTFAKSASGVKLFVEPVDAKPKTLSNNVIVPAPAPLPAKSVYDSLQLGLSGLSKQAFEYAKKGFDKLIQEGKVLNNTVLSIVDFSQPSNQKRLYIIDLQHYKVLFNTLVAHGRNTGREWATNFSNQPSSYKSSPGFYVTAETYKGNHGYSLKLQGIERGINDNAYDRAIVLHGAGYVSDAFVNAQGYIGRSEGCPAVPEKLSTPIINAIKGGSCLFIYHPSYVDRSVVLN